MKMSKVFQIAGIAAISLLVLTACGNKSDQSSGSSTGNVTVHTSGFPIVDKQITLSLMAPSMGSVNWNNMQVLKDYQKMTNIKLKYNTPPQADFSTKLNLAFASQDLPDIIFAAGSALTPANEVAYGRDGQLLPLDKLIPKYAPNFNKLMEKDPNIRKSITTPDGHIYSLPMLSSGPTSIWYIGPMWYNGEWLKNLGVKTLPKTADELYALLKRFKTEDPNKNGKADEIPFSDTKLSASRYFLMAIFGMLSNDVQNNGDKVVYNPGTSNYKAYLTFMHKLFAEGLMDKDTFSQSDDQKKAKGQSDRLGLFSDYFSYFTTGRTQKQAMNDPMFQPLTSSVSPKAVIPGSPRINRGDFSITKNNPNPAASLRWVDYFYSGTGSDFLNAGKEGGFWKYAKNSKGEKVRVLNDGITPDNSEDKRSKISPDYGLTVPKYAGDDKMGPILATPDSPKVDAFTAFVNKETAEKYTPYARVPYPLVYLTKDEQDSIASNATDLSTYVEQMEAKFITGVEPLSNWDKYLKTLDSMNVKQYVKVYQAAYDRWKKAE
ncbi:extracellular solute-binding protein [Schleiferilactobacillus shenzhenensis]|nr:extracellular solute-binding protein [Schleiferilactobacillus shenzhenensis]